MSDSSVLGGPPNRNSLYAIRGAGPEQQGADVFTFENPTEGLRAYRLRKAFHRRAVVRDVSITLNRGKAIGLLGANGAGKTTCFHLIAGFLPLDEGRIAIDGKDITNQPMYRRARMGIGYLPQESSIFRGLTVEENILAILQLLEPSYIARRQILEELLAQFSLAHLRLADAVSLSGGERRRLEIARCLASRPKFLLLDEPFAGVDPKAVEEMRLLVSQLKNHNIGVLITDHNATETFQIVDHAYVLHQGSVIAEGTSKELQENRDVRRVYLGGETMI